MGKRLLFRLIPFLLIVLLATAGLSQEEMSGTPVEDISDISLEEISDMPLETTTDSLALESMLYLRPNPPEYAVFNTDFDLFTASAEQAVWGDELIMYKGAVPIPAGVTPGTEENPTLLLSRPLIAVKYALPEGHNIPYGGIQVWINGIMMEYFDELSSRTDNGVLFQMSEPFAEGINTVEVIVTDDKEMEEIQSWQLLVQPRIESATESRLVQLTVSQSSEQSSNPVFSPDGKLIAYQSQIREEANIMVMNADGSDPRLITEASAIETDEFELSLEEEEEYAFGLSWLPDSRRIVFTSSRTGNYELFLADVTVTPPVITQLTFDDAFDGAPDVDPFGQRVAFVSNRDGTAEIFVFDIASPKTTLHQVTHTEGVCLTPRWSPDGKHIAYSHREDERSQYGVYLLDPLNPEPEEITLDMEGECRFPSWSPDGSKIAFYWEKRIAMFSRVTNVNYDEVVKQDVLPPQNQRGPVWSPDGTTIVFSSNKQHNPVYAVNLNEQNDGSIEPNEYVIIEPELSKRNMEMDWSPNYKMIAFRSLKSKSWDIWGLKLEAKPKRAKIRVDAPSNSYLTLGSQPIGFVSKTVPDLSYFGSDNHPVGVTEYTLTPPGGKNYEGTLLLRPAVDNRLEFQGSYSNWMDWRAGLRSAIIPGWGQLYRGHTSSALFFSAGTFSLLGFGVYSDLQADQYYQDYQAEVGGVGATTRMAAIRQDWKENEATRNAMLTTGSAVWAWNTIDALFPVERSSYMRRDDKEKLEKLPWGKIITSPYGTDQTLGAIGVVAYHPDSEVWLKPFLEDDYIYYGSAFNTFEEGVSFTIPLAPGQYEIRVVRANRKEFSNSLVTVQPMIKTTLFVEHRPMSQSLPVRFAMGLIPGLQQAVGQKDLKKAGKILLLTGAGAAGIFLTNQSYQEAADAYDIAETSSDAIDERERYNDANAYRQSVMGVSLGIYFHNLWDATRGGS
ncbi:MAG: hypothetical protein P9L92_06365 [Candidatus Electryonea clarkiae]|nr:hypothetical protein [Candidatus Electryonea clarkiae]